MKEIKAWISKDNKLYTTREDCASADGLVKCSNCDSNGMETYIERIPYPSGYPDSGWVPDKEVRSTRTCTVCYGLGYIESKDSPEYKEYLKLKELLSESNIARLNDLENKFKGLK